MEEYEQYVRAKCLRRARACSGARARDVTAADCLLDRSI